MLFEIEIRNWAKFNQRKDVKACSWFRLENSWVSDPDFYHMTPSQKLVWIFVLSEASKRSEAVLKLHCKHAGRVLNLRWNCIEPALKLFETKSLITLKCLEEKNTTKEKSKLEVVAVTPTKRKRNAAVPLRTNVTDITNETNNSAGLIETHASENKKSSSALVWDSYAEAYGARYGEKPSSNAKGFGICKHFVGRIPADEAPYVASFYVSHNDQQYVKNLHPLTFMLRDAEKLRTEWKLGRQMTTSIARNTEFSQTNNDAIAEYLRRKGETA